MAPDFEFFLHLRPTTLWSHTLPGLIGFCLPVGLLVLRVWERIARDPVRALLGFNGPSAGDAATADPWMRAASGVLLGAASHLVWDGFTHGDYWGARMYPALRAPAFVIGGAVVPWFNVFQHLSTVIGGLVVVLWLLGESRRHGSFEVLRRVSWRWVVLAIVCMVAAAAGILNGAREAAGHDFWTAPLWLGRVAVGAMLGGVLALLAYAAIYRTNASRFDARVRLSA